MNKYDYDNIHTMRFIKRILLVISLLCISLGGGKYGTKIPVDHQSIYIGNTLPKFTIPYEFHSTPQSYIKNQLSLQPNYLSCKIPEINTEQQYAFTDVREDCNSCGFFKKDFVELEICNFTKMNLFKKINGNLQKIEDSSQHSLEIYLVRSDIDNSPKTSYYCVVTETFPNRLGHMELKSVRHFTKQTFENMVNESSYIISEDIISSTSSCEITPNNMISQIKSKSSDLPISFRLAFSEGSEVFVFNSDRNVVAKRLASDVFSPKKSTNDVLTNEKLYYGFGSIALVNKSAPEIITICKSEEMTTADGQIIANKNVDLIFLSNTPHLIKSYKVPFVRDYGFILFRPMHKLVCWALDNIVIAFNYSSWSLVVFAATLNFFMIPAIYYDALYKHNNKKVELKKELLKTKKSNDPVRYESELAKLMQSQMPYFARYMFAIFFEGLVHISAITCAVPFSYPMRFVKVLWFNDIFRNEGYSLFNLYGILKFTPPFFLKNVGALCVVVFLIAADNLSIDDQNNGHLVKIAIFFLFMFLFCKLSIAQIAMFVMIRIFSKSLRYLFEKSFEKREIIIS